MTTTAPVFTDIGDVLLGHISGSGGGIQTVTVRISPSQLKHLDTAPVTIVAAPGAGKTIQPIAVSAIYLFGTAAYHNQDGPDLYYKTFLDNSGIGFANIATLTGKSVSSVAYFTPQPNGIQNPFGNPTNSVGILSIMENAPLVLADDQAWTDGDGTLIITVTYLLVPTT